MLIYFPPLSLPSTPSHTFNFHHDLFSISFHCFSFSFSCSCLPLISPSFPSHFLTFPLSLSLSSHTCLPFFTLTFLHSSISAPSIPYLFSSLVLALDLNHRLLSLYLLIVTFMITFTVWDHPPQTIPSFYRGNNREAMRKTYTHQQRMALTRLFISWWVASINEKTLIFLFFYFFHAVYHMIFVLFLCLSVYTNRLFIQLFLFVCLVRCLCVSPRSLVPRSNFILSSCRDVWFWDTGEVSLFDFIILSRRTFGFSHPFILWRVQFFFPHFPQVRKKQVIGVS